MRSRFRSWLRDTAGGLPATYWYLWTGLLVNRVGAFAMLFLSVYLTDRLGVGAALAGLVVGGYGLGGVAGVLLGGVLADRWGRRATLLWSHLLAGLLMAALAFAGSVWLIFALVVLVGVTHSMPQAAFVAAIVDVVPVDRRSRAFNLQFWAFNVGMAAAGLIAGLLASASYRALFLADAGATLLTALIIALKVPETLPASAVAARRRGGLAVALTDRTFLTFVALTFVLAALAVQTQTILPLSMRADGLPPAAYGVVVALGAALIVVGQLFVPRLIDGWPKHAVLAGALGLMGLGVGGGLALADRLPAYLAAAVVWTVGSMLAAPPNAEVNAELAPPVLRGRYQAVFYLTFPAAAFVAPAVGGLSLQHLGDGHWLLMGAVALAAAAGHLWAGPRREREVARRTASAPVTAPADA
jgi:MFS family permease